MIEWIKGKWCHWRYPEECGKWFGLGATGISKYCTRRHNHRGHHKEAR